MTAGEVYRCGLDWCSDSQLEWWTIPLFVVAGVVLVLVLRREVRKIRRERLDGWTYDGAWIHCDRVAWVEDDGAVCCKCQAVTYWDE